MASGPAARPDGGYAAAVPHVGLDLLFLAPGETGGMETYARSLVPLLPAAFPQARFTVFAGRELAAEWREAPWHPEIGLVALPASSRTRIRRTLAEQTLVAGAALRARVDLLHALGNIAPLAPGLRTVVTIHDVIYARFPETQTALLVRGVQALIPAAARRARRIVVPSRATGEDLVQLLGVPEAKIDVVPEGPGHRVAVEPAAEADLRARLGLGEGPLVLSVSARRPHKNLVRLIEAVGRIDGATLVLPGYSSARRWLSAVPAAHASQEKRAACSRPRRARSARSASSSSSRRVACAIMSTDSGSNSSAPSPATSGSAETFEVATGTPRTIASSTGRPKPSAIEGKTRQRAAA